MLTPAWDLTGSTLGTTSFNFPSPTTTPLLSPPHPSLSPAGTVSPNISVAAQRPPPHHRRASHPHQRRASHPHQSCATHHCRRALHPHRCLCRRTSHPHHRRAHYLHHRRAPHQRCAFSPSTSMCPSPAPSPCPTPVLSPSPGAQPLPHPSLPTSPGACPNTGHDPPPSPGVPRSACTLAPRRGTISRNDPPADDGDAGPAPSSRRSAKDRTLITSSPTLVRTHLPHRRNPL